MSGAPSSHEILRVLLRAGFEQVSQRGSHLKLRRVGRDEKLTVILKHPTKDVPKGTFSSILKQAGMSRAEFESLRKGL